MYDKILPLLGKNIESDEIKALFTEWNVVFPKNTNCTPNYTNVKVKVEKHCLRLYFGLGGNSRYAKPIPAKREGSFTGQFTMMEFTKKRTDAIPFEIKYNMTPAELTKILGEPKVVNFMGTMTTWRKKYLDKYELVVNDSLGTTDTEPLRSVTLGFIYEPDLNTMEEYEKAGL
jgi:hypothetical protein